MEKRCPSCGETKKASEFGRNKSLGDGLSFYCLTCNRERSNRWYRERRKSLGKEVRDHSWIPDGFRWCPECKTAVAHADYTKNARTSSGFGGRCKRCHNRANMDSYFFRTYGLTRSQVTDLRAKQGDRCAICGEPSPQHLDHDHKTGWVRQMLCQRCNHGLGLFRDDVEMLRAAAEYVAFHRLRQEVLAVRSAGSPSNGAGTRPGDPPTAVGRRPGGRRRSRGRRRGLAPDEQG